MGRKGLQSCLPTLFFFFGGERGRGGRLRNALEYTQALEDYSMSVQIELSTPITKSQWSNPCIIREEGRGLIDFFEKDPDFYQMVPSCEPEFSLSPLPHLSLFPSNPSPPPLPSLSALAL